VQTTTDYSKTKWMNLTSTTSQTSQALAETDVFATKPLLTQTATKLQNVSKIQEWVNPN